jgi:hypothetical protein
VAVAQWVVTFLTASAAGLSTYLYNDGRDRSLALVLRAAAVIGVVGTVLFFASQAATPPPSSAPECDWSNIGPDLRPDCETTAEASRRAAGEGLSNLASTVLIGPMIEGAALTVGAVAGFLVAIATARRPTDGRAPRLVIDED